MKNNNIGTITTALLERCAHWFLYIFISPDAGLSSTIMKKRAKQIDMLQKIDSIAWFNSYQNLVTAVATGIKKKYGLTPIQVLSMMYNINVAKVAGVGAVYSGTYFDGTNWVDGDTRIALPIEEQVAATKLSKQIETSNSSFWLDFKDVIDWLVDLFVKLGIGKKSNDFVPGTTTPEDWDFEGGNGLQESSMSATIPYIVGGVVLYYLFTRAKK